MKFSKDVLKLCALLQKKGYATYIVGGAVRDTLLGIENYDVDIATAATPDVVKKTLSKKFKIYTAGEKFGTIGLVTKKGNIEITSFREEGFYEDSRRPSHVSFTSSAEADSKRRDFTINALYCDPVSKELLDWHNGLLDLKKKEIRFVGSAEKRIKEDPLRMLRAVRFATKLGFNINRKDFGVIKKYSKLIHKTSKQRIKEELDRILLDTNFVRGLELLDQTFLLKEIFPAVDNLKKVKQSKDFHAEGNVFKHTLFAMNFANDFDLAMRYALLFHDLGKISTAQAKKLAGRTHISFQGHAHVGALLFEDISKYFPFTKEEKRRITYLIKHHMDLLRNMSLPLKVLVKWAQNEDLGDLIRLRIADSKASLRTDSSGHFVKKDLSPYLKMFKLWTKVRAAWQLNLISALEVQKILKIKPGPYLGFIIREIKVRQVSGSIKNKRDAEKYLRTLLKKSVDKARKSLDKKRF